MAATGDSITRAPGTSLPPWSDNPSVSWSTGWTSVNSHYQRLLALNPKISGKNYNDARSGAKMAELASQMSTVVSQKAEYVTVLMGGNDVCTSSEATMTSVDTFRSQFESAMARITTGLPRARIFVATIPNVYHLWQLEKSNFLATTTWSLLSVCPSMLANATSTATADEQRRLRVLAREEAFNLALHDVCVQYTQCKFDNYAVFNTQFTTADVGGWDYFHPSVTGQAHLAAGTWAASFWGP
jgi:lysophospholipase L1-like esterase